MAAASNFRSAIKDAIVTYHAPQTKKSTNIITLSWTNNPIDERGSLLING